MWRKIWQSYRTWRERRAAINELRSFSDLQLEDIGIRRSEIESSVNGDLRKRHSAEILAFPLKGQGRCHARPGCCDTAA